MTEIRFFHLERRTPEQALPELVQDAFAQRRKIIVEAPDDDALNRMDERLWTFADESFLPHAIANDGESFRQPILLTKASDNRNGADVRFLLGGAKAGASLEVSPIAAQIVILFNGSDEQEIAAARAQWVELKAAGRAISYWRQDAEGVWEKVR
jgi:DNA polymerase III subunit chi